MLRTSRRPRVTHSTIAQLRQIPCFEACPQHELKQLASLVDELNVREGRELMREGTLGHEAFLILEGWAAVIVGDEPVAAVGPGELVGEIAMIDHGGRTATVVAKTPMRLLVVGPEAWASFVEQPAVARCLAKRLAARLRDAEAALARRPAGDRL